MLRQLHEQRTDKKKPLKTHVNFERLETLMGATGEFYIFRCPVPVVLSRIRESVIFFALEPHYEVILNTNSGTLVPDKQN